MRIAVIRPQTSLFHTKIAITNNFAHKYVANSFIGRLHLSVRMDAIFFKKKYSKILPIQILLLSLHREIKE